MSDDMCVYVWCRGRLGRAAARDGGGGGDDDDDIIGDDHTNTHTHTGLGGESGCKNVNACVTNPCHPLAGTHTQHVLAVGAG